MRCLGWALLSCDQCLTKKGEIWTQTDTEGRPRGDKGRHWSYATMSQEIPGVTRSLERQVRILHSRLWREYDLANTLISSYYPPELSDHKFLLFEATQCFAMAAPGNWHTVQTHSMTYSHTWPGIWHSIFISWHLKQNKTKHTKKCNGFPRSAWCLSHFSFL